MSQFTVFSAPSLSVFEFLTSPASSACCALRDTRNSEINSFVFIAPQLPEESTVVAQQVAWPVSINRLIVSAPSICAELVDELIDTLGDAILAICQVRQVTNYQSIEFKLIREVKDSVVEHLNERFTIDLNLLNKPLPSLSEPGLVVLDMDSTSIEIECIDEIAKLAGVGQEVSEITELAMQGKLDFSQSLKARVAKLKGVELSLLDTIANDLPLMPGMRDLVTQFKKHGWKVAIASGGFTYFADNLKNLLGLDAAVSNTLAHDGQVLTGEVVGQIVDAQFKATTVAALAQEFDIDLTQTIAIGDGANDLVMMEKAGLGVAYHAKSIVQQQADVSINQGDLGAVIALLANS